MGIGSVGMSKQQKAPEFSELFFLLSSRLVVSLLQAEGARGGQGVLSLALPCDRVWVALSGAGDICPSSQSCRMLQTPLSLPAFQLSAHALCTPLHSPSWESRILSQGRNVNISEFTALTPASGFLLGLLSPPAASAAYRDL